MIQYILVFLICFAGSVIQGAASFGFSLFVMSLLPLIMPLKTSAVLAAISALIIGVWVCIRIRENLKIRLIIVPLLISLMILPIGAYLLNVCNEDALKKLLGVVIVLFTIVSVVNPGRMVSIEPNFKHQAAAGAVSGLFAGMFNIGGPPMVFYYLATIKDTLTYKAALEFTFAITGLTSILFHKAYGNIQPGILKYVLICFAATISGTILGMKFFVRLDKESLKKCVYSVMVILGLVLVIK